jgi:uncharacterized protein YceH (UPF0502 family)
MTSDPDATVSATPKWQPLSARQRRIAGVLVEKAKTTPDVYPMTVNALMSGANQKSNRSPVMNLSVEDVEDVLAELREIGAVVEVQSGGRVPRYKHCLYEWLGVDKVELAVIAELLLRGEQTVGELRGRVSRMEPLADLNALRPVLNSLVGKNLVVTLTPEGRGQVVTHKLYTERELAELTNRFANGVGEPSAAPHRASAPALGVTPDMFAELQLEVAELRAEVARLRAAVHQLTGGASAAGEE